MTRPVKLVLALIVLFGASFLVAFYLRYERTRAHEQYMAGAADLTAEDQELTAGARLINFHAATRIPNSDMMFFKNEGALRLQWIGFGHRIVLEELLPLSDETAERLALALVEHHQGSFGGTFLLPDLFGRRGFSVHMSEQMVRAMALDSRIDFIEADVSIKIS